MNAYERLCGTAPAWAGLLPARDNGLSWIVAPPLPSGSPTPATLIRTIIDGGRVLVAECEPGTRLPKCCPELHINSDSSFCLGRRSYRTGDSGATSAFWQDLGEFLVNQHHAARRKRWPAGRWLSHGPIAADLQAQAEEAAAKAQVDDEYAACLEADEGWIAESARAKRRIIARAAPCPRGCRDQDGRHIAFGLCKRSCLLQKIVIAERARRAAQRGYFRALGRNGVKCCGRVTGCPLNAEGIIT